MGDKYDWSGDSLPTIEVHSTKKHDVLRSYLRQYILVVGGRPFQRKSLKITFVDAFAGGGVYEQSGGGIWLGSPLIFLKATEEAAAELALEKDFTLDAHYIFLEKNRKNLLFLKNYLEEDGYRERIGNDIFLSQGEFHVKINDVISHIYNRKDKTKRCIFLLDQYGYSDAPLFTIKKIFQQLPKSEVILTFSVDSLINYLSTSEECKKILERLNIAFDLERLDDIKRSKKWRQDLQQYFYREIIRISGATHYTNFFIKSSKSHRAYWLLHLSMHPKARDEMMKCHWEMQNYFAHEGKPGIYKIGYDPGSDSIGAEQNFIFSGYDKKRNDDALLSDLPRVIPKEGITYSALLQRYQNFTPSTFEMIEEAVKKLYKEREICIFTEKGKEKHLGAKLKENDKIKLETQLFLFTDYK